MADKPRCLNREQARSHKVRGIAFKLTAGSFCHHCFGQLTIDRFSVKVSTPKSNGRMN